MSQPSYSPLGLPQAAQNAGAREAHGALYGGRPRAAAARQIAAHSPVSAPSRVHQAIANAARSTTVDFDYLVAQAQVESAMNPQARAATSSASGLFQFIESTWLDTVKRHGARFGLGDIADQIAIAHGGSAYVADPAQRAAILALRNDPEIASLMAAGLAEDNRAHLMPILGRQPEASELYLAHFLGAGGAGRFLSAMQSDPDQNAAHLFRRPAAANRAVFFEPDGRARSLEGVMNYLGAKIDRALARAPGMPGSDGAGAFAARVTRFAPGYPTAREPGVPYIITAEEVFAPRNPPAITGGSRAPVATSGALPSPPAPPVRRTMSGLLRESIETSGASRLASPASAESIRRAYDRLRALGL